MAISKAKAGEETVAPVVIRSSCHPRNLRRLSNVSTHSTLQASSRPWAPTTPTQTRPPNCKFQFSFVASANSTFFGTLGSALCPVAPWARRSKCHPLSELSFARLVCSVLGSRTSLCRLGVQRNPDYPGSPLGRVSSGNRDSTSLRRTRLRFHRPKHPLHKPRIPRLIPQNLPSRKHRNHLFFRKNHQPLPAKPAPHPHITFRPAIFPRPQPPLIPVAIPALFIRPGKRRHRLRNPRMRQNPLPVPHAVMQ